jgi:SM-20-related protein
MQVEVDQIIQDIRSQGWSFKQNIFNLDQLQHIQELYESDFLPAKVGKTHQLHRNEEIRGDWIRWIDTLTPPAQLHDLINLLEQLKISLNQNFFLGLKEFECHLAKYPVNSFYKTHVDRFEKDSSRSFTFIFYLHEAWDKKDGGELVLYNKSGEIIETILPLPGSMLCFMSEEFPHEVKTCFKERRSLTGWMHTKIIN